MITYSAVFRIERSNTTISLPDTDKKEMDGGWIRFTLVYHVFFGDSVRIQNDLEMKMASTINTTAGSSPSSSSIIRRNKGEKKYA